MIENFEKILNFFNEQDEDGVSNIEKIEKNQRIIRRVDTTDKDKSFEDVEGKFFGGVVIEDEKIKGLGINIFNEDVYPLQSFEIYLRNCDLVGKLDISDCRDMVFVDLYHNRINQIGTANLPSMRIFGVQDNQLEKLDVTQMPVCQGIDAGKNCLAELDVSKNPELVELYINDNKFTKIDLTQNPKLKYFYCHNNKIAELDTRNNPQLRHLNATGNPMKKIMSMAPQCKGGLPLELYADEGGFVGLMFNPVYNVQWKETGEWQQSYHAYPDDGYKFVGWFGADSSFVSADETYIDSYGNSQVLTARFENGF